MGKIKRIGVLTSGGDSPGMNAAIRAVVRTAIYNKLEVVGIRHGYNGMINSHFKEMKTFSVSDIIARGGTILKTARSAEFRTPEGRQTAYNNLKKAGIDGVVVIGGDGSLTGARTFCDEYSDIPFVGIPGSIDNDIYGTDYAIGYDTALNTVIEAVDKIRDTASSHNRLFFIEVMGRDAGFIAMNSGVACGAEAVFIPEIPDQVRGLKDYLEKGFKRKKSSNIIIVAEGDDEGGAMTIAEKVKEDFKEYDVRVSILGHIQRGGSPTAYDRVSASKFGYYAVEALLDDQKSVMVGFKNGEIVHTPFSKITKMHKSVNPELIKMAEVLSV
ncbi:MAG: 6-phosphofructokinase [Bacteroidales bacterium]|nr:6-phosphofructokinase [Bacteroidales bacterium]MCB8998658.1 6-phosphofructokinase [Bacteroidales bacterium]MCB9012474.1 6-phosphofructokinase [Bacteroidales bacterium]